MTYEDLLEHAQALDLQVKETALYGSKGRIKGNRIAIKKDIPTIKEKACILAEELGHYYTACIDIMDQANIINRKIELQGRAWAYNNQIGLLGLVDAYKAHCIDMHEVADYLNVTEEFLGEGIKYYRSKYGLYKAIDNYIIYFEPRLGIMEMI